MKRISALLVAAAVFIAVCMPVFAQTVDSESVSIKATYSQNTYQTTVYSVDIDWGSMEFTYDSGTTVQWDPENLLFVETAGTPSWTCADGADEITVSNHSNTPIKAQIDYAAGYINGQIDNEVIYLEAAEEGSAQDAAPSGVAKLTLSTENVSGTDFSEGAQNVEIGRITLTISSSVSHQIEADGTWAIYNSSGLLAFNEAARADSSLSCKLMADINMPSELAFDTDNDSVNDSNWMPLGSKDVNYTGVIDGNGYSISGLKIESGNEYVGFVSYLGADGSVRDLTLENADIEGADYVGGISGYSKGNIYGCSVSGAIQASQRVGGVVGYLNSGDIEGCVNEASVSAQESMIGGIVGVAHISTVAICYNSGTVSSASSGAGGIAGKTVGATAVTSCCNTGEVTGTAPGAIIGGNSEETVTEKCYYSNSDIDGVGTLADNSDTETLVIGGDLYAAVSAMNDAAPADAGYYFVIDSENAISVSAK